MASSRQLTVKRLVVALALAQGACGSSDQADFEPAGGSGAAGSSSGGAGAVTSSGGSLAQAGGGTSGGIAQGGTDPRGEAGSAPSSEPIGGLLQGFVALCDRVEGCYPSMQTKPGVCIAPAGEAVVQWLNPGAEQLASVEACLRGLPDQASVTEWAECMRDSIEQTAACLESCPPSAEACALAGNARAEQCQALPGDRSACDAG